MIIFDIGAHNGFRGLRLLDAKTKTREWTKDDKIFGIEPDVFLYNRFLRMYEQGMPDNYIALNYAIDINEREAKFYLNPLARGTSSLHYDIIDFEMERFASQIKTTTVRTIRLDTIIKKHNIKEIRFLHVDAQGNDLRVLQSLGEHIRKVKEGQVEATIGGMGHMYKDIDNSKKTIIDFLEQNGFQTSVRSVSGPDDIQRREVNVRFKRVEPGHPAYRIEGK